MGTPFIQITAETVETALPINPNREAAVDLQINTAFDMVEPPGGGFPEPVVHHAVASIVPGERHGEELVIRLLAHPYNKRNNGELFLLGMSPYMNGLDATPGEGNTPPTFEDRDDVGCFLHFPVLRNPGEGMFDDNSNPKMVILRWTGMRWLVVARSRGIAVNSVFPG